MHPDRRRGARRRADQPARAVRNASSSTSSTPPTPSASIDSGLWTEFKGRNRESWDAHAEKDRHHAAAREPRRRSTSRNSRAADQAALAAMRVTLADYGDPSPAVANEPDGARLQGPRRPDARLRRPLRRARRLLPRDRQPAEVRGRHDRPRRRARSPGRPRGAGTPQGAVRRLPPALGRRSTATTSPTAPTAA